MNTVNYDSLIVNPSVDDAENWLSNNSFNDMLDYLKTRVIGQKRLDIVAAVIYSYIVNISRKAPANNAIILAAPSGCGKTETYRAVKDYFKAFMPNIPVVRYDFTNMTTQGVRGDNKEAMLYALSRGMGDYCGYGIVFVDEFDKRIIPSYDGYGTNLNMEVQSQVLSYIEGIEASLGRDGKPPIVDTNKTLFICMGSFNEFRIAERGRHLGFGHEQDEAILEHYRELTRNDLIKAGASYELIGRFSMLVNYNRLDARAIRDVVDKICKDVALKLNVMSVELTAPYMKKIMDDSRGEFGCRNIRNMIMDGAMRGYIKALSSQADLEMVTLVCGSSDCTVKINSVEKADIDR